VFTRGGRGKKNDFGEEVEPGLIKENVGSCGLIRRKPRQTSLTGRGGAPIFRNLKKIGIISSIG